MPVSEQPDTKAGRDPEGALKEIEAQAQQRSTCPVCKGEGALFGQRVLGKDVIGNWIFADIKVSLLCPKCDAEGTVPQAQPDARFASIAVQHNREVRIRTALLAYRDSDDGDLDAIDVAARAILRELLPPQAQPDAELLKALKVIQRRLSEAGDKTFDELIHEVGFCDDMARLAIDQHETGAPA